MKNGRTFLTAQWRYLAMLNYEVDPDVLKPHVPVGTQLDLFGRRAFIGIVAFLFRDLRVLGIPVPLHRNFEEVNLRLYVRRQAAGGMRRGVAFIKEIAPRRAVELVARMAFNENYVTLPMRHQIVRSDDARRGECSARYEWRVGRRWNRLNIDGPESPIRPASGSLEKFIIEHYWGYSSQSDGGTLEYRVEHPPWHIWRGCRAELDCDFHTLYGADLAAALAGRPSSAFLVDGSAVSVYRGVRIGAAPP